MVNNYWSRLKRCPRCLGLINHLGDFVIQGAVVVTCQGIISHVQWCVNPCFAFVRRLVGWPVLLDLHSCVLFLVGLLSWLCNSECLPVLELPLAGRHKNTILGLFSVTESFLWSHWIISHSIPWGCPSPNKCYSRTLERKRGRGRLERQGQLKTKSTSADESKGLSRHVSTLEPRCDCKAVCSCFFIPSLFWAGNKDYVVHPRRSDSNLCGCGRDECGEHEATVWLCAFGGAHVIDSRQGEFWQGMGRGGPPTCTKLLGSELFDLNCRFHDHFLFGWCHFGDEVGWAFGKAATPKATSSLCAHIHPSKTKRPKRGEHWWRSGSQVAILAARERRVHLRDLPCFFCHSTSSESESSFLNVPDPLGQNEAAWCSRGPGGQGR